MNAFGKILIMLNLLMSLVFMGFAVAVYSTHKNWKDVITLDKAAAQAAGKPVGLQYQLADLKTERDALEAKFLALQKEIKQELAMRNARLQVLETERENLVKQVEQKAKEIETVTEDKKVTSAAIEALAIEAGKKTSETEALSTEIQQKQSEIKDLYNAVLELTDKLAKAQAALDKANGQSKVLAQSNAELQAALKRLGVENPAVASRVAAPPPGTLRGVVRAATPDGLVEVSVGSDDGLMRGHTMEVYREGATPNATKYLGRIEILSTKADVSVGKILPQYRRGNIEKDDRVATRLN
jgi:predicted  nucleic acid-binding Zn-ribbon protein